MKNFPKVSNPIEEILLQLYDLQTKSSNFSSDHLDPVLFQEFLDHNLIQLAEDGNNRYAFTNFGWDFVKVLKNKQRRSSILKKMTLEDYLIAIHYLLMKQNPNDSETSNIVSMTDIARYLGLSNSSISEYIRIIEKEGYINVIPRKGVILTNKGLEKVFNVLDKRNILVDFFNNILKIDLDLAEIESHVLEHNINPIVFERLKLLIEQLTNSNFSLKLGENEIVKD